MSYIIFNKDVDSIYSKLKLALECNVFLRSSVQIMEPNLKNALIENYLEENDIIFIHGKPYNPHREGVVERFHQSIKDLFFFECSEDP